MVQYQKLILIELNTEKHRGENVLVARLEIIQTSAICIK
jgi:hypothetical protein